MESLVSWQDRGTSAISAVQCSVHVGSYSKGLWNPGYRNQLEFHDIIFENQHEE